MRHSSSSATAGPFPVARELSGSQCNANRTPRLLVAALSLTFPATALHHATAGPSPPDRWLNSRTHPAVPPMAVARYAPTATLLTHGPLRGKVLVAGGFDGKECVDAAQLFEPSSLTWSATG